LAAVAVSGAAAAPHTDPAVERIGVRLDRFAADGGISGTVLVGVDGRIELTRAYGLANRSTRTRNRIDTRFNLASANKMFTSVSIAQLVQAGKLRYRDTIGRYVPELPPEIGDRVTIAQLLTHTGATGDFFRHPDYERLEPTLTTLEAYLPLIVDVPLEGKPGGPFRYSNSGFILLGLAVERASGLDYYAYIRRNILRRAGMTGTGCFAKNRLPPNTATGYERGLGANTALLPPRGTSAGGCYSTAPDLFRFAQALFSYRLVSRELTRTITAPKVRDPVGGWYAYGFIVTPGKAGGPPTVWHSGGFPGVGSVVAMNPGLGYVVVILCNTGPSTTAFVDQLVREELRMP
jgi:CubicO group peptidase (beta-lactamase class C family)